MALMQFNSQRPAHENGYIYICTELRTGSGDNRTVKKEGKQYVLRGTRGALSESNHTQVIELDLCKSVILSVDVPAT